VGAVAGTHDIALVAVEAEVGVAGGAVGDEVALTPTGPEAGELHIGF